MAVEQNRGTARQPGSEVMHSTRLAVVDRQGRLRAYGDGVANAEMDPDAKAFEENLKRLRTRVKGLLHEGPGGIGFPESNASLNALAAVLLVAGYLAIRRRAVEAHACCMLTALATSPSFWPATSTTT